MNNIQSQNLHKDSDFCAICPTQIGDDIPHGVKGERIVVTAQEIIEYMEHTNAEAAYNLLLLYGPDAFAGTYTEYENLLIELEVK